jgi:hypothetical protein
MADPGGKASRTENLADRVWLAYHSLPRDAKGRPPSRRNVELRCGHPRSILSKLFTDERESVEAATVVALSRALGVTADWLLSGVGPAPQPTGPVPPRKLAELRAGEVRSFDDEPLHDAISKIGLRAMEIAVNLLKISIRVDADAAALLRYPISSLIELGSDVSRLSSGVAGLPGGADRVPPATVGLLDANEKETVYRMLRELVEDAQDKAAREADDT